MAPSSLVIAISNLQGLAGQLFSVLVEYPPYLLNDPNSRLGESPVNERAVDLRPSATDPQFFFPAALAVLPSDSMLGMQLLNSISLSTDILTTMADATRAADEHSAALSSHEENTNITTRNAIESPLLQLPAELRNEIYK